jgi:predicted MPP superfamily phosphohydrolase
MLAKQVFIVCLIIPFAEYYSFIAVRNALKSASSPLRTTGWVIYFFLSIAVFLSLFAFRFWATSQWPFVFVKHLVSVFFAVFFGKIVVAMTMVVGDIFVFFKTLFSLTIQRHEPVKTYPVKIVSPISRSQFISKAALLCGAAFTSSLLYGMTNKYRYQIKRIKLPLTGLPVELGGLRILQFSDFHAGSLDDMDAVTEGIETMQKEKPDMILFTGDLVNYRSKEADRFLPLLGKLKAPLGIYAVLGNHDYGDYLSWPSPDAKRIDFEQLLGFYNQLGWRLLRNEHILLKWNEKPVLLAGVENWSIKSRFHKYGDLNKAMSGIQAPENTFRILMSHDPSYWDAAVRPDYPNIHLTLSGHTHGMQLGIENKNFKWSPSQYLYKQWAGLYSENNQYLYVNRGFGFIGYEGRLGILPEITVIDLA